MIRDSEPTCGMGAVEYNLVDTTDVELVRHPSSQVRPRGAEESSVEVFLVISALGPILLSEDAHESLRFVVDHENWMRSPPEAERWISIGTTDDHSTHGIRFA